MIEVHEIVQAWWEMSPEERAQLAITCGGSIGDACYLEPAEYIIMAAQENPALIGR